MCGLASSPLRERIEVRVRVEFRGERELHPVRPYFASPRKKKKWLSEGHL